MDWTIYGALIAGFAAVAAAGAFLAVRALQGWRTLKRFRRHLARGLGDLATSAEHTGAIVERVSDPTLTAQALARLRVSLARFNVLRAAIDEAEDSLGRFTAVYPHK
jgi:hypothetical protein